MGDIVLLAPGKHIEAYARELQKKQPDPAFRIRIAHMDEAVRCARQLDPERTDVLITRGDTAELLKKADVPFPVVEIEISDENITGSILAARKLSGLSEPVIGIIGMGQVLARRRALAPILRPRLALYAAGSRDEIRESIRKARADGVSVLIGGGMTEALAKESGLPFVLLGTSYGLVADAYKTACRIRSSILAERQRNEEINGIFHTVRDGLLSLRPDGTVLAQNRPAARLTAPLLDPAGRLAAERLLKAGQAAEVQKKLSRGESVTGLMAVLNRVSYALSLTPILVNGTLSEILMTISDTREIQSLENKIRKNLYLHGNTAVYRFSDILGNSPAIRAAVDTARTFAPLKSGVLLIGQTGTGKELFAQSIHNASDRSGAPFVAVNCGSIPDSLMESELFGYVDGAFTGAKKGGRMGYFELAHGGTVFLDEISEMSLQGQSRLLRVLQEKQVRRVGSDSVIPVDVRIIAACNVDLARLVAEKKFRRDLYYRLSVLVLPIPPLRQRKGDAALLADAFLAEFNRSFSRQVSLSAGAKAALEDLSWEGNIRQLRSFCERLCAMSPDGPVTAEYLRRSYEESYSFAHLIEDSEAGDDSPEEAAPPLTREHVLALLEQYGGNRARTACALHISRTTLWKRLKEWGF